MIGMNHNVTTREALLKAAILIIQEEGSGSLSIRSLASKLGIATGSVYNYFPSKAELLLAVTEEFWKKVFHQRICQTAENTTFIQLVETVFFRLSESLPEFRTLLQGELHMLEQEARVKGRKLEQGSLAHMKKAFLSVMNEDRQIKADIWTQQFTKEQYVEFVFSNLFQLLMSNTADCTFLLEVIRKSIYRDDCESSQT